ncbi:MAG: glycoside hydrolase family 31 protein [Draconibacterium sp.]
MRFMKVNLRGICILLITGIVWSGCSSDKKAPKIITIPFEPGEKIWSGAVKEGHLMPFAGKYKYNFYANNNWNQIQPLLLSNKGLYVWSEEPFKFDISDNHLIVSDSFGTILTGRHGTTLAEARSYAARKFFPSNGEMPDTLLFSRPQYNTWIELTYNQNQEDILKYARAIVENNFPTGVLMIDDTWQEDYGIWDFHPGRFPDPGAMVEELHKMGFKVMLWVCPFVSPDQSVLYRTLKEEKIFFLEKKDADDTWETASEPAMIRWWNGVSAQLDFSNSGAVNWFNDQLDMLVERYGIDGFKLDAGDMVYYPSDALSMEKITPNEHSRLYSQFGLRFPLNEYRSTWKMAGLPLVQRLHDKFHTWEDLQKLVPHMITEGLVGYTFSCPDMIGGGDYISFLDLISYDQDLVVRSAQCHALMPMMQFSVAPWRILDKQRLNAVQQAVNLRMKYTALIMELARQSAKTGEPIIKSLEYVFPEQGFEHIHNEFMLGDSLLVAPVQKPGYKREIILPTGTWLADDGKLYEGGKTYDISVPIERLPYFKLINH